MTYQEAKAMQAGLESARKAASVKLRAFPCGAMGLTPDHVKFSPEYREAKARFEFAFAKLRAFNIWFVKRFKVEIRMERRTKTA